ncbi:hypothetical protein UFOVP1040_18 [uncultured Caudovirales phage]|uniref:Uncharacterized protein n=1 Tax=uncultured Caudovirales phage TaxID=2100421 RepID=A0A6J5QC80_9CAUD|nr:hypothetical protein UFOVP1040_18 [uncultured Caudovirales phage]
MKFAAGNFRSRPHSFVDRLYAMLIAYAVWAGVMKFAWTANVLPNSFKNEILLGTHVLGTDALKVALYDNVDTPAVGDTVYSATNELATAGGYTQNSKTVSVAATFPKLVSNTAVVDFDDVAWTSATFSAYGCKIYNSAKSNKLLCMLWFNGVKTVTAGTFTIVFPTGDDTNGTIRIA